MLKNHLYNILLQLTQEHKSLWRIKNEYEKDSRRCKECAAFWKKLARDKEKHSKDLLNLLKKHL